MAEFSGPWATQALPDNRYQRLFGESQPQVGDGVVGDAATQPGISVNAGATALTVQPIEVNARGRYYRSDAAVTITPAPADSQRRIDRLVCRFNPGASTAGLVLLKGTPGTTSTSIPATPSLTDTFDGTFDVPLARFEVNPLAPTIRGLIVDAAYMGLLTVPVQGHARPGTRGMNAPSLGQPIWDNRVGAPLWWNGSAWVDPRAQLMIRVVQRTEEIAPIDNKGTWTQGLRYDSVMPQFGTFLRVMATVDALVTVGTGEYGPQFRWSMNNSQFGQIRQIFPPSSAPGRWQTGTFVDWVLAPPKGQPYTLGLQFRNNTGQDVGMRVRNFVGTVEVMG